MTTVKDILECFEKHVPLALAEDWDNCGIQIGTKQRNVQKILTTLDVTKEAVDYAVTNGYNFIMSHHPMIFKGIKSIQTDSYIGSMITKLIKHDITVYAAHTNLDIAAGGLNDMAADRLGLHHVEGLYKTGSDELVKLVVFVPISHAHIVREAMSSAGAGHIGNYSDCSFSVRGTGRFKPLEGTNPFMGTMNTIEAVEEERIETIVPKHMIRSLVTAMLNVHPYEEVAYDIYPLLNAKKEHFLGRIGMLPRIMSSEEFATYVRNVFPKGQVRFAGAIKNNIERVAICTGSAVDFMRIARTKGAQAYVTGDVKYHEGQLAKELGIFLVDAGHFGTEEFVAEGLVALLHKHCSNDLLEGITITPYKEQKDFFLDL